MEPVGRGGDQAIGHVVGQHIPIHLGLDLDGAHKLSPADHHLIYHNPRTQHFSIPDVFRAQQHALFQPVASVQQQGQQFVPFVLLDLGQEAKMPDINPQDRQVQWRADTPCTQHGPIPTQGDQQVKFPCFDALDQRWILKHAPGDLLYTALA